MRLRLRLGNRTADLVHTEGLTDGGRILSTLGGETTQSTLTECEASLAIACTKAVDICWALAGRGRKAVGEEGAEAAMCAGGDDGGQDRRQRIDGKWASPDRKWTKKSDEKASVDGHGHAAKELHSSLALGG